jgi:methylisocitrate lyase
MKFQELMSGSKFIPALGVWDPFTAKIAESLGIECVHLGGYQMGATLVTSEPLMTQTEVANITRYVTAAVKIPVVVDVGAGFGEPLHVMRMTREMEGTGAACLQIEDQIFPKRVHYHKGIEHIVSREEFIAKIKAMVSARSDPSMAILARTDAMRTDGYKEGVERANLCIQAGADMVMVAPNTMEEAESAPKDIEGPVFYINSEGNRFGRPVFTVQEFQALGYRMASYPTALLCPVTQEMKRVITNLVEKGDTGLPQDKMIVWRNEIEEIIGLDELYKIESDTVESGKMGPLK